LWLLFAAVLGCGSSATSASDAEAVGTPPADASAPGSAGDAASLSPFRPATSVDIDAMLKAWCDWDVRCTSDYPVENCDERRASYSKPEAYAAGAMADLATCFATLSCDFYEDRCVGPVAMAIAKSTPSRSEFLGSCIDRAGECTGEDELDPLTCYWLTLSSDPVFPQIQACVAKPCSESLSCLRAVMK
jgi:hypothetical protein